MTKPCRRCGAAMTGQGVGAAVLCVACWVEVLRRWEMGEGPVALAREYGVTYQMVWTKRRMYGG